MYLNSEVNNGNDGRQIELTKVRVHFRNIQKDGAPKDFEVQYRSVDGIASLILEQLAPEFHRVDQNSMIEIYVTGQ